MFIKDEISFQDQAEKFIINGNDFAHIKTSQNCFQRSTRLNKNK